MSETTEIPSNSQNAHSGTHDVDSTAHLRLENVTKTFNNGQVVAVDDFNLDIGSDEFIVFLGPSGCGKTTTLRCISGLEKPTSGHVYIDGNDVTHDDPKDRNLAVVFQDIALFPHMPVRKNIRFGLDMNSDLSPEEKEKRVREAADVLGIEDLLDRKPSALSGGQQQRVAIGRAMVTEPEAFLFDEPFSALDANLRDQMQTEIQQLHSKIGKSMIFVTHNQDEAMTLGDRIVVLNDGNIQQIGTPYEIYSEPANLFVAGFIGSPSTNLVEGEIEVRNGAPTFVTDLFSVEFSSDVDLEGGHSNATLAIRPSPVELDEGEGHFDAEITVIEPQGDRDVIHLSSNEYELRAFSPQGQFTEIGSVVPVTLPSESVWLFDESGERLL